jgi:alkanesulfonate monooxygenase
LKGETAMALRFHWRLPIGGETTVAPRSSLNGAAAGRPDLGAQVRFCHEAARLDFDSLLIDFGLSKPDPLLLASALGAATEQVKFLVAYRPGLTSPTLFTQQVNTLSALIGGRVSLNFVAGNSPIELRAYGDYLSHDERYARMDEFLSICQALWRGVGPLSFRGQYYRVENAEVVTPFASERGSGPEIFISGTSQRARDIAVKHDAIWLRFADTPDRLRTEIQSGRPPKGGVGLRLSVLTRPTRDEAVLAARSLVSDFAVGDVAWEKERAFVRHSDSHGIKSAYGISDSEWLDETLWSGAVRFFGAAALTLVGSPDQVASALVRFHRIGVSHFVLSGWPKLDAMIDFGENVLPLVREKERTDPSCGPLFDESRTHSMADDPTEIDVERSMGSTSGASTLSDRPPAPHDGHQELAPMPVSLRRKLEGSSPWYELPRADKATPAPAAEPASPDEIVHLGSYNHEFWSIQRGLKAVTDCDVSAADAAVAGLVGRRVVSWHPHFWNSVPESSRRGSQVIGFFYHHLSEYFDDPQLIAGLCFTRQMRDTLLRRQPGKPVRVVRVGGAEDANGHGHPVMLREGRRLVLLMAGSAGARMGAAGTPGHSILRKGADLIPLIADRLAPARFAWCFLGVGWEPYAEELTRRGFHVTYPGPLANPGHYRFFPSADVYLMLSRLEGGPLTLLEAMGVGLWPLCTPTGVAPEVVTAGVNGDLLPALCDGNEEEVADAVAIALDRLDRDSLLQSRRAVQHSVSAYNWRNFREDVISFIGEVFP